MVKIHFTNAQAKDNGYGLEVNGKRLENLISEALGTRVGNNYGYNSNLPSFESSCCNITVIIDPQPSTVSIETAEADYSSVEEMEEELNGKYQPKVETPAGEE